jgi:hypothetical protein
VCEGILVPQPSRFYPCPSGRDNFKAVRGLDNWTFCLALCLQNVWFISVERLATFDYVVGVFLPRKFKLIHANFKMVSQRKKTPFVARPFTRGKVLEASLWRVRGRSAEGTILGERVWCLAVIEISSAKNELCDC